MKDNNLEKHFRRGLRDLEAGPPDGAKDAIEKHLLDAGLLKDKAETRGGLWMFVVLALLIATPVVYVLQKTQVIKIAETNSANNLVASDSKSTNAINENANGNVNISDKASSDTNIKTSVVKHERGKHALKNKLGKLQMGTPAVASLASPVKNAKKDSKVIDNKNEEINYSTSPSAMASNVPDVTLQPIAQVDVSTSTNNEAGSAIDTKEPDKLEEKKDTLEKKPAALKDTSSHPKPPAEKIHKEVAFDFSGAPQFNSIVYGNGSQHYQQYVDESRRSEKETPSFAAAFGIVISFNKWLIETGVRHSVLSSEFSYQQTVITFHKTRSPGDPHGWSQDSTETTSHYIATNKIAFMEFPLLAGYRMHAGKFEFEVKAGPMMSFITSANTTVISLNTGTVVQSNDLESSPYRKTGWSILSAADVLYSIGNRFSAFVQPSLKTSITSIFKESAPVTKKVESVSVGIGIRMKL